eukprot:3583153-Rhodomonas_salina.6
MAAEPIDTTRLAPVSAYARATQCPHTAVPGERDRCRDPRCGGEVCCAVSLRLPYAMSGTDLAYGAISLR